MDDEIRAALTELVQSEGEAFYGDEARVESRLRAVARRSGGGNRAHSRLSTARTKGREPRYSLRATVKGKGVITTSGTVGAHEGDQTPVSEFSF